MPFTYSCAHCAALFTKLRQVRSERTYCSSACYHAATIKVLARPCQGCGLEFRPIGNGDRSYCSRACYETARAAIPVTKHCPVCDQDYTVSRSIAHRYSVCSEACKTASTKYVDCERCGSRFRAEKRLNRRYCSEECRRPPVFTDCRTCGVSFRVLPGTPRSYCSRSCYRKFTGETKLERRVRLALVSLGVEFAQEFPVGPWLIDFALIRDRIAIEADGDYWHAKCADRDARRDSELADAGWRVVRLRERDIKNAPDVVLLIGERLNHAATAVNAGNTAQRQRG